MKTLYFTLLIVTTALHGWVNQIGNQSCFPLVTKTPATCEELSTIITLASLKKESVRVIGNGYSISNIACTEGCLIDMQHLNRVLSVDLANHQVRVEAGISICDLNNELATYGLALPNQAAIDLISLGGALSTGVHGSGRTGSLSSFIKEIELITADGQLRKFSQGSEHFSSVCLSLGTLGAIYAVTLQCEPLFYLSFTEEECNLENLLKNYQRLLAENEFIQFLWSVETDKVMIQKWNRCETGIPSYQALTWFKIDKNDKDLFSEITVPFENLRPALKRIKEATNRFTNAGAKIVDINIRFISHDNDILLSPSSNGPAASFAFCLLEENKYFHFFSEFEDALIPLGGRPHFGKINFLNPEKMQILYGSNFERFCRAKQELDPGKTFSNSCTKLLLGED